MLSVNIFPNTDFEVNEVSISQRKHIIITGENGSGKTAMLEKIYAKIHSIDQSGVVFFSQNNNKIKCNLLDFQSRAFLPINSAETELFDKTKNKAKLLFGDISKEYDLAVVDGGLSYVDLDIFAIIKTLSIMILFKSFGIFNNGIVLIDQIDNNLHLKLQKSVLPSLIECFPDFQFIVTTHSPFVVSSAKDAVICDLTNKTVVTDLSAYSYKALVESYFDADIYSNVVKEKLKRFEQLSFSDRLNCSEKAELIELRDYLESYPKYLCKELALRLQQIFLAIDKG